MLYCDPANLEQYGKQIIEKLKPEFNIVNTRQFKRAMTTLLKAALIWSMKDLELQVRLFQKVEKQVIGCNKGRIY